LETFTQPCAERSKSLVEQTDEIKVESLLESNDIQSLGNKLRFLVAPRKREYHESDALFFDSSAVAQHAPPHSAHRHCQFFIFL
jgi:hypothetical protein